MAAKEVSLGTLTLQPGRQLLANGEPVPLGRKSLEILSALADAGGDLVTKDELMEAVWPGLIVEENAIQAHMVQLRKVLGDEAERLKTVRGFGYRLIAANGNDPALEPTSPEQPRLTKLTRRRAIGWGLAGSGMVAGAALTWRFGLAPSADRIPDEVAPLMAQAINAQRQSDPQGLSQAIGLYRRVVATNPEFADGWGLLAMVYSKATRAFASRDADAMDSRTRAAAARAQALDPDNPYAQVALVLLDGRKDNWLAAERIERNAVADHPDDELLLLPLGTLMATVGRMSEAAGIIAHAVKLSPPSPALLYSYILTLWSANRLEEADRVMAEAYQLYPIHIGIWFTRIFMLMFSGRAREAIVFGQNESGRPPGIPDGDFELVLAAARALDTRKSSDVDLAMRVNLAAAHRGAGYAGNTIKFASALGRLDEAFAVADAYYFGRGFEIGEVQFSKQQAVYARRGDRSPIILFQPPTRAMRADPRFMPIVQDLGLVEYWAQSGSRPDYQRGA